MLSTRKKQLSDFISRLKEEYQGAFDSPDNPVTPSFEAIIHNKNLLVKARMASVEVVGLPIRAYSRVIKIGAKNAHQAILMVENQLPSEKGIGSKTMVECDQAINAFITKLETHSIAVLNNPANTHLLHCKDDLISVFPLIIECYITDIFKANSSRNLTILLERFGCHDGMPSTLAALGSRFKLTRERVRQLEERMLRELRLLFANTLNIDGWALPKNITYHYHSLKLKMNEHTFFILEIDARSTVSDLLTAEMNKGYFDLLMSLYGYCRAPSTVNGFRGTLKAGFCLKSVCQSKYFGAVYRALDWLFDQSDSITYAELQKAVNKKVNMDLDKQTLDAALLSISEIERVGDHIHKRSLAKEGG